MLTEKPMLDKSTFWVEQINNWIGIPIGCNCENCDLVLRFKCL